MPITDGGEFKEVALQFTEALVNRDYPLAYSMTSKAFKSQFTADQMRADFETIVPTDWQTVGPIGVGEFMQTWPDKKPSDVAWVYVYIGGDEYSEAVTLTIANEDGDLKIRDVEYGRP